MRLLYILLWNLLFQLRTLWISLNPVQDAYFISFKSCRVYHYMLYHHLFNLSSVMIQLVPNFYLSYIRFL